MEINYELQKQIFEIIKNQLELNDPPEVKITFDRLKKLKFNDHQVRQLIGQCIAVELFDILYSGKEYDNDRYIKHLKALPDEPFDD